MLSAKLSEHTPANEHSARARLTTLWMVMLALNVLVVLISYLFQAFGPLRDGATQAALLKALDAVFFVFAANVSRGTFSSVLTVGRSCLRSILFSRWGSRPPSSLSGTTTRRGGFP
jgi:hypothetical protein